MCQHSVIVIDKSNLIIISFVHLNGKLRRAWKWRANRARPISYSFCFRIIPFTHQVGSGVTSARLSRIVGRRWSNKVHKNTQSIRTHTRTVIGSDNCSTGSWKRLFSPSQTAHHHPVSVIFGACYSTKAKPFVFVSLPATSPYRARFAADHRIQT